MVNTQELDLALQNGRRRNVEEAEVIEVVVAVVEVYCSASRRNVCLTRFLFNVFW